jgi:hypothetical protein
MPTYKHVARARLDETVREIEAKGERFIAAVPEDQFDLVTIVSEPVDPTRVQHVRIGTGPR